ncbi:MAG TPA: pyridoxal phosphate-dependent aminotransferase [Candidatus Acidoferrales bacterium]
MFSKRTDWKLEENAYTRALRRHTGSGKSVLDLTVSNPTTCGFQYDETAILSALCAKDAMQYEPEPKGLAAARTAVLEYYRQKNPSEVLDCDRLVLTTGTSEAYSFLFRLLCEPGDEIVIAQPSYPLLDFLATIQDVKLRPFPLIYDHGWQIDFDALHQVIGVRTRAILVVHPNNPTGNFIGSDEAEQLQTICGDRSLALVVDEVFLDYKIQAGRSRRRRHGSFVSSTRALTFVLSGLSKISALPQMKVGWIAASGPGELVRDAMARLEIIADTFLSLSAPMQHALPVLLGQREKMQPQLLRRIETNLAQLDVALTPYGSVSRLEIEGGWYAVLRVPAVESDEELSIRLLQEHSVLVQPGHFYGFADEGYLVVSLLTQTDPFAEGIRRLLACVASK